MKVSKHNPLIEGGRWFDFDGSKFLICHMSSIRFQRALAKYQEPHRKSIAANKLDPEIGSEITRRAMSEGLLLDWKNVLDEEGQPLPFSAEMAFVSLTSDPAFREFVSGKALDSDEFRQQVVSDAGEP